MTVNAQFSIGDLVYHKLFDYRGVIVDVDPRLMLSDDWYEAVARSRPPKDQPWYRVLVHDATHETYVAERNLEPDTSGTPIRHHWSISFSTISAMGTIRRQDEQTEGPRGWI